MVLNEGSAAPDFTLPLAGGGTLTLSALKGRKVVLYAYPKDDTSGCTNEALDFTRLRKAFAAADTVIVGVSPDSVARHDRFKAKYALDIDLVADEEHAVLEAYGSWVEKSMYGRSYMGVDRSTFLIDRDGKIARIWRKVKVKGHAEEVLLAAEAL
jgi:peroxiredoxin Q/BCP